ncbi:hypothetical protein VULLAG_LOCUS13576 [Vulpes lagopus]|uniref:basic proline-rich protein-like n=1 Tax=Vulpes lagopus TaxID=494514 RepID=UPI001BC95360|nr:basic proline-rich protein-like [Vulpes lagopus]XP_041579002.1 basic proline-rich protein-like [Vulpes lagopus]
MTSQPPRPGAAGGAAAGATARAGGGRRGLGASTRDGFVAWRLRPPGVRLSRPPGWGEPAAGSRPWGVTGRSQPRLPPVPWVTAHELGPPAGPGSRRVFRGGPDFPARRDPPCAPAAPAPALRAFPAGPGGLPLTQTPPCPGASRLLRLCPPESPASLGPRSVSQEERPGSCRLCPLEPPGDGPRGPRDSPAELRASESAGELPEAAGDSGRRRGGQRAPG